MDKNMEKTILTNKQKVILSLTGLAFVSVLAGGYIVDDLSANNRIKKLDEISKKFLESDNVTKKDKDRYMEILNTQGVKIENINR